MKDETVVFLLVAFAAGMIFLGVAVEVSSGSKIVGMNALDAVCQEITGEESAFYVNSEFGADDKFVCDTGLVEEPEVEDFIIIKNNGR